MSRRIPDGSPAKLSRPRLANIFKRARLFRLLDRGGEATATWISGPAGSGKTTLVAGYLDARALPSIWYQVDEGDADPATFFYYLGLAVKKASPRYKSPLPLLTPEYSLGVPAFTRRYFESLCARLKTPFALVFDNYQEVFPSAPFHDIFREGLSAVPEGIRVFVISRTDPPRQYVSLRAGNKLPVIGWDELRMTVSESRSLLRREAGIRLRRDVIGSLSERAGGWAAGLLLMAKEAASGERAVRDPGRTAFADVFNYFASELFDKADQRMREFLLKTSYCRRFTPAMAEAITGNTRAAQILAELNRSNYFTERRTEPDLHYQYHALFRDFLRSQAEQAYPPPVRRRLLLAAAKLQEKSARIEDAAELFIEARDWKGLGRVVLNHAQDLVSQGRNKTVEAWIAAMPEETVARSPWLIYWKGICRLPFTPRESMANLERAFSLFSAEGDATGVYLAWSGVMDAILLQNERFNRFDPWIAAFRKTRKRFGSIPSPAIECRVSLSMFSALALHSPHHPDAVSWRDRALTLSSRHGDRDAQARAEFIAAWRELFVGNTRKASSRFVDLYKRMRGRPITPSTRIIVTTLLAIHHWLNGENESCQDAITEALHAADESGVHLWDTFALGNGVASALSAGDMGRAEELLRRMNAFLQPGNEFDRSYYYYLAAWRAAQQEDWPAARELAVRGVKSAEKLNYPFPESANAFAAAVAFSKERNDNLAKRHFTAGMKIADAIESPSLRFIGRLAHAEICIDRGDETGAKAALRKAFSLGREQNYVNAYWWRPEVMSRLCVKSLEAGIEVDYALHLIRKRNLVPDEPPLHIDVWPWPYRVRVLGRFGIERNGKALRFSGKVQKKPLELLKLLAAHGGRELRESHLIEALWPAAEGDAARQSLKTTLHRLRQVLGEERAIRYQDGTVGLDPRVCWTDVVAFERVLNDAHALGEPDPKSALGQEQRRLLERAIALYRGNFLDNDGDRDREWALSPRERLRSKFLRAVTALAVSCEQAGRTREAAEWYLRGLDVDDLAEDFYLGLMKAYSKLGRKTEAVKVYARCRSVLAAALSVEPAPELEALYRSFGQ